MWGIALIGPRGETDLEKCTCKIQLEKLCTEMRQEFDLFVFFQAIYTVSARLRKNSSKRFGVLLI